MPNYKGFAIDVGGPLRVSDIEMFKAENIGCKAHIDYNLEKILTPMQAWQLYGVMSAERYVGFMKAALAIERSGMSYEEVFDQDDPVGALNRLIDLYVTKDDQEILEKAAKEAEVYYNDHQSKRLADGAVEALEILKSKKIPRSVVTSLLTPKAKDWVKSMGLDKYFEPELIFGVEPDTPRGIDPKPEQLVNSAKNMGIEPVELVYVGDTRGDMKASQEAECSIALITEGMTPPVLFDKFLEEMPYFEEAKNFFKVKDLYEAVEQLG